MSQVFISYSRQDEDFVREFVTKLQNLGINVWVDVSGIDPGQKWSESIQKALNESTLMLVIISPDSMASENVRDEWQFFLDEKKPIIPIIYRPARIHFQLNRFQYVDFSVQNSESSMTVLVKALRKHQFDVKRLKLVTEFQNMLDTDSGMPVEPLDIRPGTIIDGRYQVTGLIGGGGQGVVYLARDLAFDEVKRHVAIKVIQVATGSPATTEAAMKYLKREVNMLATLNHRAIPALLDLLTDTNKGVVYVVMQNINGSDLETVLNKTHSIPIDKIIDWAIELCDVLYYLHKQKPNPVVFRDLKPANIMLDSTGHVWLIDFGLAKMLTASRKHTQIGTEGYAAPEQFKGVNSISIDIYALGTTLHHLLTRTDPRLYPPFSFNERPITQFNRDASPELQAVVEKALSFDPDDRYADMGEFMTALRKLSSPSFVDVTPVAESTKARSKALNLNLRWTFTTEDEIRGTAYATHDRIVFGCYDTNVYCLDRTSGQPKWKFATQAGIVSKPCFDVVNNLFLLGSEDHTFYALNANTGYLEWTLTTRGMIRSSPTLYDGCVYFGNDVGEFLVNNSINGKNLWTYEADTAVRGQPLVTDNGIIFGCDSGEVICLNHDGERVWMFRARKSVQSMPVSDGELCYFGSSDGMIHALDMQNGYAVWRFRDSKPILSTVLLLNNFVIATSTSGNVYAINKDTGKEKWRFACDVAVVSSATMLGDYIVVTCVNRHIYVLAPDTGKLVVEYQTEGTLVASPAVIANNLYIGDLNRKFYALELE